MPSIKPRGANNCQSADNYKNDLPQIEACIQNNLPNLSKGSHWDTRCEGDKARGHVAIVALPEYQPQITQVLAKCSLPRNYEFMTPNQASFSDNESRNLAIGIGTGLGGVTLLGFGIAGYFIYKANRKK